MKIFQVIIGSEILEGRREDKHFEFLKNLLLKTGYDLFASFIAKQKKNTKKKTKEKKKKKKQKKERE